MTDPKNRPDATIILEERHPMRSITRDLRCDLTEPETLKKGEQLARQTSELNTLKSGHKAQKAAMSVNRAIPAEGPSLGTAPSGT